MMVSKCLLIATLLMFSCIGVSCASVSGEGATRDASVISDGFIADSAASFDAGDADGARDTSGGRYTGDARACDSAAQCGTVACIDGEWHALPARLLSEVLRLRGWQVDFLGAKVPTYHLISHLHLTGPDAVALSGSIATRLPAAHATITACQAAGTPVLVGGAAFGADGRYAYLLGANAWAPDARTAADLLAAGLPDASDDQPHSPIDDLPHLADQEYTLIAATARSLVKQTMADLAERIPEMRHYTEQQLEHTAEDVVHIVDYLATALYTDSPELFTGFLRWTAEILAARGVSGRFLLPTIEAVAVQLRDFTRASRMLDDAHDDLSRFLGDA